MTFTFEEFTKQAIAAGMDPALITQDRDSYGEYWVAYPSEGEGDFGITYRPATDTTEGMAESDGSAHVPREAGLAMIVHAEDGQPWKANGTTSTWRLERALVLLKEINE